MAARAFSLAIANLSVGLADEEIQLHIGRRIRARRRLLGMSQRQVAIHCGLQFQQIQKYESGVSQITASRLWRITEILSVPVGYFFDGLPAS